MLIPLFSIILGLVLDRILGEPKRFHPLVGFGIIATKIEEQINWNCNPVWKARLSGGIALLLMLVPIGSIVYLVGVVARQNPLSELLFSSFVLYLVIGARSLSEHALAVKCALDSNDITLARKRVGYIVSRETANLDATGVAKASIESVLENGSDSIFAPIFWFILGAFFDAGAATAVAYRVVNTLDAMWGYRNDRFYGFGWSVAKLDDVVNWIPARLCALSYALVVLGKGARGVGLSLQGLICWQQQAKHHDSPNAGPVMASGAGALNVELGGAARYYGKDVLKPPLGIGIIPKAQDITRCLNLVNRTIFLWVICITSLSVFIEFSL